MNRSEFLKLALATAALPLGVWWARPAQSQTTPAASPPLIDAAGRITRLKGAASAMQDAVPRPLKEGDLVYRGDVISTGREARLEMKMLDDAVVNLGEKTVFVVIDYVAGGATPSIAARLIDGAFTATSGTIAKSPGGSMRIETDVATAGIRGTTVWGGKLADKVEFALLSEGQVEIVNRAGRVELTRNGDGTTVGSQNTSPTTPIVWGAPKLARARATVAF